jgi:glycosyltransferase involved in cell wall biosynthesis
MRFVTGVAGARDLYQVPLALHEGGLLERHVTDFYSPDLAVAWLGSLLPKLKRRRADGLPSRMTRNTPRAVLRQLMQPQLPLHTFDQLFAIDDDISRKATEVARRSDAGLLLYSGAGCHAFEALPDRRRILFQFHPHPAATRALLEADLARHPEVKHSFTYELDSQPLDRLPPETLDEWRLASDIICASSFTKQSLVSLGCEPDRIRVVPYGTQPVTVQEEPAGGRSGIGGPLCRFLFVGQGVQRKGLHHLFKAWKRAGLADCELVVVHSRLDPGIAPLAEQPNVVMRSRLSHQALIETMSASDVFVMPSLIEGFGLVYLEALAAGLHCIGTRNTGLPDIDPPEACATIVEIGAEDALATALTEARRRMVEGGFDRGAIRAFANGLSWPRFRQGIRDAVAALSA